MSPETPNWKLKMQLSELIETLQEYQELHGGDCEVRLMMQPSWPFEYSVAGVCSSEEIADEGEDEAEQDGYYASEDEADPTIYLVERSQECYGTKVAWDVVQ